MLLPGLELVVRGPASDGNETGTSTTQRHSRDRHNTRRGRTVRERHTRIDARRSPTTAQECATFATVPSPRRDVETRDAALTSRYASRSDTPNGHISQ